MQGGGGRGHAVGLKSRQGEGVHGGYEPPLVLQGLGRDLRHVLGHRRGGRGDDVRGARPCGRGQWWQEGRVQDGRGVERQRSTGGRQSLKKKRIRLIKLCFKLKKSWKPFKVEVYESYL